MVFDAVYALKNVVLTFPDEMSNPFKVNEPVIPTEPVK